MTQNKFFDCITFFDDNLMFEIRYNILKDKINCFVICESKFDHTGKPKKVNFKMQNDYDPSKIKYFLLEKPFPQYTNRWENQAIQRDYLLECLNFVDPEDYIFFSDPDEIINPDLLNSFNLNNKFGIFMLDFFNYKFNLFNPYESPWEGTRVVKKKNLKSIDFLRQKIKAKNLKYSFYRFDKKKDIQIYNNAGWHFNNIKSYEDISIKLKTFAHSEFSGDEFSSIDIIKTKIENKIDLFNRGHKYEVVDFDNRFPKYILKNKIRFKEFIL